MENNIVSYGENIKGSIDEVIEENIQLKSQIEDIKSRLLHLEEQQKKDNLLMIKSLLEATEEIISATVPEEGGTP